jgi:3-oxoacyl-(acyl-carrier-protein) synthase
MRVAITGMASWSALGRNLIEFERRLRAGESGVRPVTRMDVSHPFFRSRSAAVLVRSPRCAPRLTRR